VLPSSKRQQQLQFAQLGLGGIAGILGVTLVQLSSTSTSQIAGTILATIPALALILSYLSTPAAAERRVGRRHADAMDKLESELAKLRDTIPAAANGARPFGELDDVTREKIVTQLTQSWEAAATEDVIQKIREELFRSAERASLEEKVSSILEESSSRLSAEINSLGRRGNLNLVLGIAITVAGLAAR
jgi:hypothetical protein